MKIARTSSTLGIIRSRSRSWRDFEIFLHLRETFLALRTPTSIKDKVERLPSNLIGSQDIEFLSVTDFNTRDLSE